MHYFNRKRHVEYFPIDISDVLIDSAKELCIDYKNLKITGIIDTYENGLDFIEDYDGNTKFNHISWVKFWKF